MSKELFNAIETHDLEQLRCLLKQGADPNAVRTEWPKLRPLHAAIAEMEDGAPIEQVRLLLEHGADINATYPDVGGLTPLLGALFNRNSEAVSLLLDAGADPNARSDEGDFPLRWSAEQSDHETARLLLSKGAHRTINGFGGIPCMTALGIAASKLDLKMVKLLLQAGANVGALDMDYMVAKQHLPGRTGVNRGLLDEILSLLEIRI